MKARTDQVCYLRIVLRRGDAPREESLRAVIGFCKRCRLRYRAQSQVGLTQELGQC